MASIHTARRVHAHDKNH